MNWNDSHKCFNFGFLCLYSLYISILHGFAAEAFGLPLLPPYFGVRDGPPESYQKGMNFAVQGATALDSGYLFDIGIPCGTTNLSLIDEMRFFKDMLPSFCLSSSGKPLHDLFH